MKRTVFVLFLLLLWRGVAVAQQQEMSEQEVAAQKEEINNIKLGNNAVYAEVIETMTDDNEAVSLAKQKSINLLQSHVIEVFAKRLHMEKKDLQEIWDVIDDKCQNIVIKKGDLFRVFTYIAKDALGLTRRKPKKGDVEKYLMDDPKEVTAADTTVLQEGMKQLAEKTVDKQDDEVLVDNLTQPTPFERPQSEQPVASRPVAEVPAAVRPVAETPVPAAAPTVVTVIEPAPVPAAQPVAAPAAEPAAPVKVPDFIQPVMQFVFFNDLMAYLKQEQNRSLIYGSKKDMLSVDECYVVILEKSSRRIVAVLGKGADSRLNYTASRLDKLSEYSGGRYIAIFVQEY